MVTVTSMAFTPVRATLAGSPFVGRAAVVTALYKGANLHVLCEENEISTPPQTHNTRPQNE